MPCKLWHGFLHTHTHTRARTVPPVSQGCLCTVNIHLRSSLLHNSLPPSRSPPTWRSSFPSSDPWPLPLVQEMENMPQKAEGSVGLADGQVAFRFSWWGLFCHVTLGHPVFAIFCYERQETSGGACVLKGQK